MQLVGLGPGTTLVRGARGCTHCVHPGAAPRVPPTPGVPFMPRNLSAPAITPQQPRGWALPHGAPRASRAAALAAAPPPRCPPLPQGRRPGPRQQPGVLPGGGRVSALSRPCASRAAGGPGPSTVGASAARAPGTPALLGGRGGGRERDPGARAAHVKGPAAALPRGAPGARTRAGRPCPRRLRGRWHGTSWRRSS